MMFTQRSLEHEWFYSLKVLTHVRSKELVDFHTCDTQISCLTGATVKHVLLINTNKLRLHNMFKAAYDWWYCAGARGEQQWAGPRPAAVSCCRRRRGIQLRVRVNQVLRPLRLGRRAVVRHHPHRRHPARSGQMSAPGNVNMVLVRLVFRIRTRRTRKFFWAPRIWILPSTRKKINLCCNCSVTS